MKKKRNKIPFRIQQYQPKPQLGFFCFMRQSLCCGFHSLQFSQMVFAKVKTAGNQSDLQKYAFNSASAASGIAFVPFDRSKCAFRLYTAVHPQKGSVNTVQILQDFFMDPCQFRIQSDGSVSLSFTALIFVWTAGAILALIHFFRPSVFVALDRSCFPE